MRTGEAGLGREVDGDPWGSGYIKVIFKEEGFGSWGFQQLPGRVLSP